MSAAEKKSNESYERPDVFSYNEYKVFLRDYFHFMKVRDPEFSTRKLAAQASISNGYFSSLLNSNADITTKALEKIIPILELSPSEAAYLRQLCKVTKSASQTERIQALEKLQSFKKYSKLNPEETKVFNYFSRWFYSAIREMADLPDFQPNPKWIHEKLNFSVPISEIVKALEFLIANKLIKFNKDGSFSSSPDLVECEGNVYRFVLTHYHKQYFDLAAESIDNTDREKRNIQSLTLPITPENFVEAKRMMDETIDKITKLNKKKEEKGDVYHFFLLSFPLTKGGTK